MGNNRPAIRATLKTILINAATSAGSNVYTNRETTLWQAEMPAIIIYTKEEPAQRQSFQSKNYIRNLQLVIEVKIFASSLVDDSLDTFIAQVENAIENDQSIAGTLLSSALIHTEVKIDSSGEQDIAVGTLTYDCQYVA